MSYICKDQTIYCNAQFLYKVLFYIVSRSRNKEYIPIVGLADFNKLSAKLIFGADRYVIILTFLVQSVICCFGFL